MSRSRRRTPVIGMTVAESEQYDKRLAARAARAAARVALAIGNDVPDRRTLASTWTMAKDGKQWFDPERHPRLMRK